jgi:hypothetical protein
MYTKCERTQRRLRVCEGRENVAVFISPLYDIISLGLDLCVRGGRRLANVELAHGGSLLAGSCATTTSTISDAALQCSAVPTSVMCRARCRFLHCHECRKRKLALTVRIDVWTSPCCRQAVSQSHRPRSWTRRSRRRGA